jgi:hypothetical protein
MSRWLLPWLVCACAPSTFAPGQLPPPPLADFSLRVGNPSGSRPTTAHVFGGEPGEIVQIVASKGVAGAGACPAALGGRCLGITPGTSGYGQLGRGVMDEHGMASIALQFPPGTQTGGRWAVQAVVEEGANSLLSEVQVVTAVAPNRCVDDGFEPNDAESQQMLLGLGSWRGLSVCNSDRFIVDVPPGEGRQITYYFDPAYSDEFYVGLWGASNPDGTSVRVGGTHIFRTYNPGGSPRQVQVQILYAHPLPTYGIDVSAFDAVPCGDDAYEDNDAVITATPLVSGVPMRLNACANDADHYWLQAAAGDTITIDFRRDSPMGDLQAILFDPNLGTTVGERGYVDGQRLTHRATRSGIYTLKVWSPRVDPANGGVDYSLLADVVDEVSCADDDLEPNDTPLAAPTLLPLRYEELTACVSDGVDYYKVHVPAGVTLTARASFDQSDGDVDLRLLTEDLQVLATSGTTNDQETVRFTPQVDRTVYIEAHLFDVGFGPPVYDGGNYTLDVVLGSAGTPGLCAVHGDRDRDGRCEDVDTCLGDDAAGDDDGDGLCNDLEVLIGSDPADADTDDDGLHDGEEAAAHTSPLHPDSDNDGVCDGDRTDNEGDGVQPADACVDLGVFAQVSVGDDTACAIRTSGAIVCWGRNHLRLLDAPSGRYSQVSVGRHLACALGLDGAIACWGEGACTTPTPAPAGTFSSLDVGHEAACATDATTGALACWGCGTAATTTPPAGAFQQVSLGYNHRCALRSNGQAVCWGSSIYGEGSPPAGTYAELSASLFHSCGRNAAGQTRCWGITDGSSADHGQVTQTPAVLMAAVDTSATHNCGIDLTGQLHCWGSSVSGQLNAPAGSFTHLSTGIWNSWATSCAVNDQGGLQCWGDNTYGEASPPSP